MIKEIDIKNWKEHMLQDNITTNSRWISSTSTHPSSLNFLIPNRSFLPKPSSEFHGLWIAEIPYQMILRYTKIGDIVWSQFGGSGVDKEVCDLLDRKCIINDLEPKKDYIIKANSQTIKLESKANLILSHPPYWDIVKFSEDNEHDGSLIDNLHDFLSWWEKIVMNSIDNLLDNGFFILCCGNMYKNSEEIELGSLLMQICLAKGFILKQHIIKDYGETKGSSVKNYNINYYRQLKGKYGNFYGDNIYVLQKGTGKNNVTKILKEFL